MKKLLLMAFCALMLAGCKADLYSSLSENEANAMLAVLMKKGIECDKTTGAELTWTLRVGQSDIAEAVEILRNAGYPRDKYDSIGDVFKKEGMVSSPMEERVRFIYALSQEMSNTISQIDGVITARVHIVLPDNNPLSDHVAPSSASVFIKHRADADVRAVIPQIKEMVTNSIEGLSYEKVSVVLFGAREPNLITVETPLTNVLTVKVARDSVSRFWAVVGTLTLLLLLALGALGFLYTRRTGREANGSENP